MNLGNRLSMGGGLRRVNIIQILTGGDMGITPDKGDTLTALIGGESELPELRDLVRGAGTGTGDAANISNNNDNISYCVGP